MTTARDHDREPVFAPRAGSRRRQGKREHWPVMATKYAFLGLHPHWVDSWGACEYRTSCTGRRLADHGALHPGQVSEAAPWWAIPAAACISEVRVQEPVIKLLGGGGQS